MRKLSTLHQEIKITAALENILAKSKRETKANSASQRRKKKDKRENLRVQKIQTRQLKLESKEPNVEWWRLADEFPQLSLFKLSKMGSLWGD